VVCSGTWIVSRMHRPLICMGTYLSLLTSARAYWSPSPVRLYRLSATNCCGLSFESVATQSSTPVRKGILESPDGNTLRRENVMGKVMRTLAFVEEKRLIYPPRTGTIAPDEAKSAGESARKPRKVVHSTEGVVQAKRDWSSESFMISFCSLLKALFAPSP
jgi:hypothetical protein